MSTTIDSGEDVHSVHASDLRQNCSTEGQPSGLLAQRRLRGLRRTPGKRVEGNSKEGATPLLGMRGASGSAGEAWQQAVTQPEQEVNLTLGEDVERAWIHEQATLDLRKAVLRAALVELTVTVEGERTQLPQ